MPPYFFLVGGGKPAPYSFFLQLSTPYPFTTLSHMLCSTDLPCSQLAPGYCAARLFDATHRRKTSEPLLGATAHPLRHLPPDNLGSMSSSRSLVTRQGPQSVAIYLNVDPDTVYLDVDPGCGCTSLPCSMMISHVAAGPRKAATSRWPLGLCHGVGSTGFTLPCRTTPERQPRHNTLRMIYSSTTSSKPS